VGFLGRLAVDPDRTSGDQLRAIGAGPHEPGAPQPFVEALPVAVFLLGNGEPLQEERVAGDDAGVIAYHKLLGIPRQSIAVIAFTHALCPAWVRQHLKPARRD
jgi:hypothetical protein